MNFSTVAFACILVLALLALLRVWTNRRAPRAVRVVLSEFALGKLTGQIEEVKRNVENAPAYKIRTNRGDYFVRPAARDEDSQFLADVAACLSDRGVLQPQFRRTKSGGVKSRNDCTVCEMLPPCFVPANCPAARTCTIFEIAEHLANYNRQLAAFPTARHPAWLGTLNNAWDKADSLDWLLSEMLPVLEDATSCQTAFGTLHVSEETRSVALDALKLLSAHRSELVAIPKQLTHGDLNPTNILCCSCEAKSSCSHNAPARLCVIDFTAYSTESHVYSLLVFLFWQMIFRSRIANDDEASLHGQYFRAIVERYHAAFALPEQSWHILDVLFVKVATRML